MNFILSSVKKGLDFDFVFDAFLPLFSLSFFIIFWKNTPKVTILAKRLEK
jgi:hypothetical protein